jgi:hypothetical protein
MLPSPPQNFKKHSSWIWIIGFLIVAVLLAFFMPNIVTGVDMRLAIYFQKWVAVYLNNEQIFYGHIASFDSKIIKLRDVYYLTSVNVGDQKNTTLVKRGQNEISSPENAFFINRSQVLYFEYMKDDSQILKLIQENEAKK